MAAKGHYKSAEDKEESMGSLEMCANQDIPSWALKQ